MWSAHRLRKQAHSEPSCRTMMFMCTQPSDPGTGASVHVAPASSLHQTLDVSSLPTHFSPGTVTQLKTGSRILPLASTTGGWRTKTPPPSVAGRSTVGDSHVSPAVARHAAPHL